MKFFLMIVAVIFGANFYIFFRLWHLIPAGFYLRPTVLALGVFLSLSLLLGIVLSGVLPASLAAMLYKVGTAWFIISIYCLMAFLLLDLLRLTPLPMNKILHENWITLGILAVSITALMTYGYFNYKHKERVELPLSIEKPITSLKIVALSDLHLGYTIGRTELEQWVELINRENPDIVLMAGDILDNRVQPLIEQNVAAVLRKIKSRYGVYACLGNHEYIGAMYFGGGGMAQTLDFLKNANITILQDAAVLINNEFYVVGREDYRVHSRKSLADLLQNLDRTKPIILLDHQPFNLDKTAKNSVDLQLSGHTHNGQVFPANLLVKCMYELAHGHLQKGKSHIYVSSGIGIWGGKFRIGTRSEYVVIELNSLP